MAAAAFAGLHPSIPQLQSAQRRRALILIALAVFLSLLVARLVLLLGILSVAGLVVCAILLAIGTRPRFGFFLMVGATLFFEGGSADPLMLPGRYLSASLQTTLGVPGAILIPFEMLLLLTSAVWMAQAAMRGKLDFRSGDFGRLMLFFVLALVFGLARGFAGGANFNYMFWESRFLFSMALMYVLAANTVRSRKDVQILLTMVFVLISLSGLDGVWRVLVLIEGGLIQGGQEVWFGHEAVIFWGLLFVLVLAQQVFGAPRWQRIIGPIALPVTMLAMLLSERRAGLIAVMIAFVVFAIALMRINRKAFFLIAVPVLAAGAIYLPLFWNNTGTLGQGARAVRSISSPDPRDAASNAWRDLEAINVRATIASDPLLGIGFGRPFLQIVTVPDISFFEFWNYESHHNTLWVWMKTGAVGFILFFTLMFAGIARSIWVARTHTFPEFRTFGILAAGGIVMSLVFCYVDLGLTGDRIPLLLGTLLGTVGVLRRIEA